MILLKKVAWKAWALLSFFVQAVHTASVSQSQFDKHLIMPWIFRWYSLCMAVMPPKKNPCLLQASGLCALGLNIIMIIPFSPLHAEAPLSLTLLSVMWSSLSHRLQVKTDTSGTQLRSTLSYSEAHTEDIGRTVHIYFSSANKMSRHNEQQKHYPMSIYYPPVQKLSYSVREINIPNIAWDSCGMQ